VARAVWPVPAHVVRGTRERYDAFAASRAALAASGTVALELAIAGVPMVIGYRLNRLTGIIARRLLKIRYVCLLNLLVDRLVVPEFLQENCRADRLAPAVLRLMEDGDARQAQLIGAAEALTRLGLGGDSPTRRAAREILSIIKERA